MDLEIEDDWDPNPNSQETIMNMQKIIFNDKNIKQLKKRIENLPFDDTHIKRYAQENWINDEEDDDLNEDQEFDFQKAKCQLMNEQIFYNPLEDHINELYISKKYANSQQDQVLSCGNCFTQICYHFQQHENYKKQYRSLITINTQIDENKLISPENETSDEVYFLVRCAICKEGIGAFEVNEKLYHLFNVSQGFG